MKKRWYDIIYRKQAVAALEKAEEYNQIRLLTLLIEN
jgi:hypothetical protein